MLPILNHKKKIVEALAKNRKLVLTAPPGTGKSTQIPQFFADRCSPEKKLIMLEPRRIAARSLAYRVAEETGCACGAGVGYQVRFDRKDSDRTKILFMTYGTFLQSLHSDPLAVRCSIIAFDEFHERSLEADTALAWVRFLQKEAGRDCAIMVLSATLEQGPLLQYLEGGARIDIEDRAFPIDMRYQPHRQAGEHLSSQVGRALGGIENGVKRGSVLVFMPGAFEIERTYEMLFDWCRRKRYRLLKLHGRMPLHEQQEVLRRPAEEPCVILSTNVAETSLTVPGVTAVIDSGLARVAAFDLERERNTLYLRRITLQNARQRTGRAGRLGPGVCIRLWSMDDEKGMQEALPPEILRLGLAKTVLTVSDYTASLEKADRGIEFLTPPTPERWKTARDALLRYQAIQYNITDEKTTDCSYESYALTDLGRAMSRLPLEPAIASVLLRSPSRGVRYMSSAMAAILEGGGRETEGSRDLFTEAENLIRGDTAVPFGREVRETFEQLERIMQREPFRREFQDVKKENLRKEATRIWMDVFSHRTGIRTGESQVYTFADGRNARLALKKSPGEELRYPGLLIALQVHEQAGRGQVRKAEIPLFLPVEASWIEDFFPGEVRSSGECRWDKAKGRVVVEDRLSFRGVVIERRESADRERFRDRITAFLAEQLVKGAWEWQKEDPKAEQYLYRVRQVSSAYPEMNVPAMNDGDLELVYYGLCEGKTSLEEIKKRSMIQAIREYIGYKASAFVEKKAPETFLLPSGRKGRVTYFDNAPPELSARLGDFIGYGEKFTLMDGRVRGSFNILAPNYRTVQKTKDLGSFWKNVYPAIRNGLKRKYPRHPWP